jgi:hypothetical protein
VFDNPAGTLALAFCYAEVSCWFCCSPHAGANHRSDLSAAQDQLRRTRRRAAASEGRAKQLQDENERLRQRVALLETVRADDEGRNSACAREFLFSQAVALY